MSKPIQNMPPVRLKGVGDSLWVTVDTAQPEEVLKEHLIKLFERMKHLVVNARVVIDTGKENGSEPLIEHLGAFLKQTFDVGLVSGPPIKRSLAQEQVRRQDMGHSWQYHRSDVLMLAGRVRSGQKVRARKHLLIMGDVNPGAEIVAPGDILVMGSLCGSAIAGQPENEEAIIVALDFRPTQIQIGGFVAAGLPASSEGAAEFAHVEDGLIVVEDYLKAKPFKDLPWPQVR